MLVVGPNSVFLRYIEQVLPSLGETGVLPATLDTLVPGVTVTAEDPPPVAAVKADLAMVDRLASLVASYERVPAEPVVIGWDEHTLTLTPEDVTVARSTRPGGRSAPQPRPLRVREEATAHACPVRSACGTRGSPARSGRAVGDAQRRVPQRLVNSLWPLVTATTLVGDMYADADGPLRRDRGAGWVGDVPLIDEAWALLGDPAEVLSWRPGAGSSGRTPTTRARGAGRPRLADRVDA